MALDFTHIDKQIDFEQLQIDIAEANKNDIELPDGTYIVSVDKLEMRATKDNRPMFFIQFRITEGEYKKHCIFYNRVLYGTKNDGNAIQSVITILKKFETETIPTFKNYQDFTEVVADIYEEIQGNIECEVDYKANAFNRVSIVAVYDI